MQSKSGPLPAFVNSFISTQPHPFIYTVSMAASMLMGQRPFGSQSPKYCPALDGERVFPLLRARHRVTVTCSPGLCSWGRRGLISTVRENGEHQNLPYAAEENPDDTLSLAPESLFCCLSLRYVFPQTDDDVGKIELSRRCFP